MMCPYCGALLECDHLMPLHQLFGETCPGAGQIARCAESDARPLWNGQPNRHFVRASREQTR